MAVANANDAIEMGQDETDTSSGFWGGVRDLFSTGSEYTEANAESLVYERRLWDHRIERFLDASLPDYLHEFGILDEIALRVRDERVVNLTTRTHEMLTFVRALDDDVGRQEERLAALEKAAKKRSG